MDSDHVIVLGNGPSLADFDLPSFGDFPTIGMNAAYRFWERINWFPRYYACLDSVVVVSHQEKIKEMVDSGLCEAFFLHQGILESHPDLASLPNVFILASFLDGPVYAEARLKHRLPILDFVPVRSLRTEKVTTGVMSARFCAYLGYRKIMLLGVDANYVQVVDGASRREGIVLEMDRTPGQNPNYFFGDYQQAGDRYNLPTPPTFKGNMHLDVFRHAEADLSALEPPVQMVVGTRKSALFAANVVPYMDPEAFLDEGAASERKVAVPNKGAPQPPYIPEARNGLVFQRMETWGGIEQVGVDEWVCPERRIMDRLRRLIRRGPTLSAYNSNAIAFVFSRYRDEIPGTRPGFLAGDEIAVRATVSSPKRMTVRLRLHRDGPGPQEMSETLAEIGPSPNNVILKMRLKNAQSAVRFEVNMSRMGRIRITTVSAS